MIEITITRRTKETWTVKENVCTHEEPTNEQDEYRRPVMKRDFAVHEVSKSNERTETLLKQEVDDAKFELVSVIKAINGIVP